MHMELDALMNKKADEPLVAALRQDLSPLSQEELQQRILLLEAEIARVKAHMQQAHAHIQAANALFKS